MIANTMVDKAFKAGKLTNEERVKLQDSIEVEGRNDRVPKSENDVFEKLRKEFKKLKIENNRDGKDETKETKNIHGIEVNFVCPHTYLYYHNRILAIVNVQIYLGFSNGLTYAYLRHEYVYPNGCSKK